MKTIIIALMFFLNGIAYSQGAEIETITIDPYMSLQNYEHFKRLTLSSPDSYVEYIEGFEFHWGYTYNLRVKKTKLKSRLTDGTQYEYSLEEIISKTKEQDTSQFKMFLDPGRYYYEVDSAEQELNKTLCKINDTTFLYFDHVEIEVPSTLIKEFIIIAESKTGAVGTFIYVDKKRIRLIDL